MTWTDRWIEVIGEPRGKGRPRFFRKGNGVGTYTDDKTAAYENLIRLAWQQQYGDQETATEPIIIYIDAEYTIPDSWPKRKKLLTILGRSHKTTKPDLDNIVKAVLDGLNHTTAWKDDAQVCRIIAGKYHGDRNRLIVHLVNGHDWKWQKYDRMTTKQLQAVFEEEKAAEDREEAEDDG